MRRDLYLAQMVNHSTQHRSEVAVAITEYGHSPGDLDVSRSAEGAWSLCPEWDMWRTGCPWSYFRTLLGYNRWAWRRVLTEWRS
jgi:hypothetical protein